MSGWLTVSVGAWMVEWGDGWVNVRVKSARVWVIAEAWGMYESMDGRGRMDRWLTGQKTYGW